MRTYPRPLAYNNQSVTAQAVALVEQGRTDDDIGTRSPDSAAMLPYWQLVDDIIKGKDAVIAQGKVYLPQFNNEIQDDYNVRLKLAKFTNVFRDIVENLASKPFEKEVQLKDNPPQEIEEFITDVDGSGNSLTEFAANTFFNGIGYAMDWIFIDYPDIEIPEGTTRTKAQEKQMGIRPFWTHILAINVLEAKSSMINGKEEWSVIRILEPGEVNRVRKMVRTKEGASFEIWREHIDTTTNRKTWVLEKSGPISIGIIPMVLFITGRRDGKRYFVYPSMRDAADMQIELYQQESGSKFIRTIAAYPMVAGNGVKPDYMPDKKTIKPIGIGPMRALYAPMDGDGNHGTWSFMSPDAALLTYLDTSTDKTISQLRELGRQPLTAQSGNLTVITTAVAAGKAKSAVAAWALGLGNALEMALYITGLWLTVPYLKPAVDIYTDFDDFSDTAEDKTALTTMRGNGDLSRETLWEEMKRRRVLSDTFDPEQEEKRLLEEIPGDDEIDENGNVIKYDANGKPIPAPAPGNAQK